MQKEGGQLTGHDIRDSEEELSSGFSSTDVRDPDESRAVLVTE